MLARNLSIAFLGFCVQVVITQSIFAQDMVSQSVFEPIFFDAATESPNASPEIFDSQLTSYEPQDEQAEATAKLQDDLRLANLRLRELEYDFETKFESSLKTQDDSSEATNALLKRIDELETRLEKQSSSVDSLQSALPGLVHHGRKGGPKITFFGRLHTDYWAFPKVDNTLFPLEGGNPQDRFNFRRLRIGVKGDLNDNMFYKYEGEFALGNNPSYRDAILGFKDTPYLGTIIIGNHKRPYSLDQLNSSNNNVFIERPFVADAFNEDNRRMGISSNRVSKDQRFNFRSGIWNQQVTQNSSGYVGDHYQLEVASRAAMTAWYDESSGGRGYFHVALATSYGVPDGRSVTSNNQARYRARVEARTSGRWFDTGRISGANENSLIGIESVLNAGAFQLVAEYMRTDVDRRDDVGADVNFDGGYIQASYFLTGEHIPWNRKTGTIGRVKPFENFFAVRDCDSVIKRGWGAWQLAARYSFLDLNDEDIVGGEGESYSFGVNWLWNEYARMQFDYMTGNIEQGTTGFGDYNAFGVRFMVNF